MKDWLFITLSHQVTRNRVLAVSALTCVLMLAFIWYWPDDNLHVVFCDVGQGDAILIRRGFSQILVDGGPDSKVLDCLSKYMPFWDRSIEMIISTHPHDDHFTGLISVIQRYTVLYFVADFWDGSNPGNRELYRLIAGNSGLRKLKQVSLSSGNAVKVGKIYGSVIWPDNDWLTDNTIPVNVGQLYKSPLPAGHADRPDKKKPGNCSNRFSPRSSPGYKNNG